MSLLTLDDARAQCHIEEDDYPDEQLQPYMDAADSAVSAYLNRSVFATQDALDTAMDGVADAVLAASTAYNTAVDAANDMDDDNQQAAALAVAQVKFDAAQKAANDTTYGIVVNPAILAATRLMLGHLFANREATSTNLEEMPLGMRDLLRPYRRVMMP
jgi:hypothetical protein